MTSSTLTLTQAAAKADVSERTMLRAIHTGELPSRKQSGRLIIDAEDLERWLAMKRADDRRCAPSGRVRERALLSLLEQVVTASAEVLANARAAI
jgi:excisionase family DNA binding protein